MIWKSGSRFSGKIMLSKHKCYCRVKTPMRP
jgi:hypothetical protein